VISRKKSVMERQSKKLQMQGLRSLRNEAYLQYVAIIYPVKSALPSRLREFNRAGMQRNAVDGLFTESSI